jgi:subtilisin family serine protease
MSRPVSRVIHAVSPTPRACVRLAILLVGLTALLATSVGAASAADPGGIRLPGRHAWDEQTDDTVRLVVTFVPGTSRADARGLERASMSLVEYERAERQGIYETSNAALGVEKRRLERDPSVSSVTVSNRLYRALDPQDEGLWHLLWGLDNTGQKILGVWGEPNIDVDAKQTLGTFTGGGVVVAVIDDGVDFSQPDLAGQAWVNPGESGGGKETNGVDDDANGYIDDVNGWDFCHDDKTVHDHDDDFHGTHVAGTIAAKLNGVGVVGVSPGVKIMALKFIGDDLACGWDDQAVEAIEYAKSFGVRISNNSWGRSATGDDTLLYDAIADSGMLFVASAGNSGVNNDASILRAIPASFPLPNILSVAAVDNTGFLADFSNYGATSVDVAAPGVSIVSTFPDYDGNPAGYYYMDGTSMASPHVTGIAAIVGAASPGLLDSPTALKSLILDGAKAAGSTAGLTVTGRIASAAGSLDTTAPTAFAPSSYAFLTGVAIGSSVKTRVRWPAGTDDLSGIGSYAVRQSVNGAAWTTVTAATTGLWVDRPLTFNATYQYRVRAHDHAGNNSAYVDGPVVRPKLYQQTSGTVTYGGTWTTSSYSSASGGSTRYATKSGAWVRFSFTGRAVGVVAPRSPTRGSVKVYVDGVYAGTVSAYRGSGQSRILLLAKNWASSGSHTIKLVLVGTAGHPRFDIDAFATVQ